MAKPESSFSPDADWYTPIQPADELESDASGDSVETPPADQDTVEQEVNIEPYRAPFGLLYPNGKDAE